jgi:hypothetical protein
MWFFDHDNNPNDAITETLVNMGLITGLEAGEPLDQCYLAYFHKDGSHHIDNGMHPTEEPDSFTECHPWSENSCCFQETVESAEKLNEAYGAGYHWDRCGTLSPACERFFVQEACFYECEPNIGLYRKYLDPAQPNPFGVGGEVYNPACDPYAIEYDDTLDCDHNTWQVSGMPIKASFCDAWWLACRNDYFCATGGGSYFSCAESFNEDTSTPAPSEAPTFLPTSSIVVTGTATVNGLTISEFLGDENLGNSLRSDIAAVAGVESDDVEIVGVREVSGAARRLLQTGLEVDFEITLEDQSQAENVKSQIEDPELSLTSMVSYAAENGLGTITTTISQVEVVDTQEPTSPGYSGGSDEGYSSGILTVTAIACLLGGTFFGALIFKFANKDPRYGGRNREESTDSFRSDNSQRPLAKTETELSNIDSMGTDIVGQAAL